MGPSIVVLQNLGVVVPCTGLAHSAMLAQADSMTEPGTAEDPLLGCTICIAPNP